MSFDDEPVRGFPTPPTGDFLTEGVEQHNHKRRTSLARLGTTGEVNIFTSFRLGYSRFAKSRSDDYVLSRLATGRADVADTKMKNTDTPIDAERHRHITTRRRGVIVI